MTTPEALLQEIADPDADAFIEDLGEADIKSIRTFLDGDLYAFALFVCGFKDLIPTLHGDLAKWIGLWGKVEVEGKGWLYYSQVSSDDKVLRDYRRSMTQIPREHFKTSLGTIANSLWQASRVDPDGVPGVYRPVAIFNERQDNATKWLRSIRDIVQSSNVFQLVYKDLIPPGIAKGSNQTLPRWWKWADNDLDFAGKKPGEVESSISAHGIESATTGGHWPKLILDDLISVKHQQSQVEMERTRAWVRKHIYLMRPVERSIAFVDCTPWTYTDVYVDMCRDYGYKLYRRSALEDRAGKPSITDGFPIFPEKLSRKTLLAMHVRDPFGFNSQMMCIPLAGEEQSFNKDWMKFGKIEADPNGEPVFVIDEAHYAPTRSEAETTRGHGAADTVVPPRRVPLHWMSKAIIIDPAPTERSAQHNDPHARTAILVEGMDSWGRRYILESWADRLGYMAIIDKIFSLAIKWSIDRVGIEEINFSNVYRHWILREQRKDGKYPGYHLQPFPLKPAGREKHARILSREPEWRQGLYYLNTEGTFPFQVEFVEYPNSQTVDLLDCMGYDKEALQRPESPDEAMQRRKLERQAAPYSVPYHVSAPEAY